MWIPTRAPTIIVRSHLVKHPPATPTRMEPRVPNAPRRIVLPVLALVAAALAVVSVVTSSTAVCGACHTMKPFIVAHDASPHADIGCYSCHLQAGAWDFPAFKLGEFGRMYPRGAETTLTRPASLLSAESCLRCHRDVLSGVAERDGLRIKHATCATGGTCDTCHAATAHGDAVRWKRAASMEVCVSCHLDARAPASCGTCHGTHTPGDRLKAAPWADTHQTGWKDSHGLGDLRYCRTCHAPAFCTGCHKVELPHPSDFPDRHGADARRADNTCADCHDQKAFCDGCHVLPMPHPAGFVAIHDTAAHGPTDARCMKCHRQADCERCHTAHEQASVTATGSAATPGGD